MICAFPICYEGRSHVNCSYNNNLPKDKETLGALHMSITLIVMMVSFVSVYVQTYQIVHIKYMKDSMRPFIEIIFQ